MKKPLKCVLSVYTISENAIAAGLRANGLVGADLKPWHMRVDYQWLQWGSPKPVGGSFEAWSTGVYQWRRSYSSNDPRMNGSEWSLSKTGRFQSKPGHEGFDHGQLDYRIVQPVIYPLYMAALLKPEYELDVKRIETGAIRLNCVSVVHPEQYAESGVPGLEPATVCLTVEVVHFSVLCSVGISCFIAERDRHLFSRMNCGY